MSQPGAIRGSLGAGAFPKPAVAQLPRSHAQSSTSVPASNLLQVDAFTTSSETTPVRVLALEGTPPQRLAELKEKVLPRFQEGATFWSEQGAAFKGRIDMVLLPPEDRELGLPSLEAVFGPNYRSELEALAASVEQPDKQKAYGEALSFARRYPLGLRVFTEFSERRFRKLQRSIDFLLAGSTFAPSTGNATATFIPEGLRQSTDPDGWIFFENEKPPTAFSPGVGAPFLDENVMLHEYAHLLHFDLVEGLRELHGRLPMFKAANELVADMFAHIFTGDLTHRQEIPRLGAAETDRPNKPLRSYEAMGEPLLPASGRWNPHNAGQPIGHVILSPIATGAATREELGRTFVPAMRAAYAETMEWAQRFADLGVTYGVGESADTEELQRYAFALFALRLLEELGAETSAVGASRLEVEQRLEALARNVRPAA